MSGDLKVKYIKRNLIDIDEVRIRTFTGKDVSNLVKSIKEIGLLHPITVSPLDNGRYKLLAGFRRLQAFDICKISDIPVVEKFPENEIQERRIEWQENFSRKNLNNFEASIYISMSKRLYEESNPETKQGASGKYRSKEKIVKEKIESLSVAESAILKKGKEGKKPKLIEKPKTKPALRFTKALSQEVGVSERTIQDLVQVGNAILNKEIDEKTIDKFKKGEVAFSNVLVKARKLREETRIKANKANLPKFAKPEPEPTIIRADQYNKFWLCQDCSKAEVRTCPDCNHKFIPI